MAEISDVALIDKNTLEPLTGPYIKPGTEMVIAINYRAYLDGIGKLHRLRTWYGYGPGGSARTWDFRPIDNIWNTRIWGSRVSSTMLSALTAVVGVLRVQKNWKTEAPATLPIEWNKQGFKIVLSLQRDDSLPGGSRNWNTYDSKTWEFSIGDCTINASNINPDRKEVITFYGTAPPRSEVVLHSDGIISNPSFASTRADANGDWTLDWDAELYGIEVDGVMEVFAKAGGMTSNVLSIKLKGGFLSDIASTAGRTIGEAGGEAVGGFAEGLARIDTGTLVAGGLLSLAVIGGGIYLYGKGRGR